MECTIKHTGDGNFECHMDNDGRILVSGPNQNGMLRFTYFPDFTIPPVDWSVHSMQLLKDYHAKIYDLMVVQKKTKEEIERM
mgnify:CR=1 FL=1